MDVAAILNDTTDEKLRAALQDNPDGVLEQIAKEYSVSTFDVVKALPSGMRTIVSGERFQDVLTEVEAWGDILFIVHTPDIVLECVGRIPPGTFGRGYYNMHGDTPIGGHIKADNCTHIAFVARPFMKRTSCSIKFFNGSGEAIFKIFVRRDKERKLIDEQHASFTRLMDRYSSEPAN